MRPKKLSLLKSLIIILLAGQFAQLAYSLPTAPPPPISNKIPIWEIVKATAEKQVVSEAAQHAIDIIWPKITGQVLVESTAPFAASAANGAASATASASAQAGSQAASTVGANVLAAASILNGINELSKAETDKQKGFAVAQVGVGALVIAFPPAGAIAGI